MNIDPRPIEDLVTRVDADVQTPAGRLIGFIASGAGEGTSTLAEAYARTSALMRRRRVLLLREGPAVQGGRAGLLSVLDDEHARAQSVQALADGVSVGHFGRPDADAEARDLVSRDAAWQAVRGHYDEVVLDLPASSASRVGLTMASHCDGVVVVLQAEKTRAPVAENLVASLRAVHARVIGSVLNRRRFHVPPRVYRWL